MIFYANISKPDFKLKPVNSSDLDELVKLRQNTTYKFEVVHPRNYSFHKKLFALLNLGFANQDKIQHFKEYRLIKEMQAGYYTTIITEKGKVYLPESISFSSMDELEFAQLYKNIMDIICAETKITSDEIAQELINFM